MTQIADAVNFQIKKPQSKNSLMKPLNNTSLVRSTDKLTLEHLMKAVDYVKRKGRKQPLVTNPSKKHQ